MSEWFEVLPERWEARKVNDLFAERREKVSDIDYPPLSVSKGAGPRQSHRKNAVTHLDTD